MDNFRDSYFQVDWDLTSKRLRGTYWGKQYDTGRGFAVTVINGGQVVAPSNEVLRLKWEKPDNTTGYVNATIVNGKFIVENIDQMFTVHGSVRADFELSVGGEFVASITFYVKVEKAVAVDAVASSSQFTALQDAVGSVDSLQQQFNNVVANVTVDSEVIAARGTEPTLGARLDSTDAQLAEVATRSVFKLTPDDYELGSLSSTTGELQDLSIRIRTKHFLKAKKIIVRPTPDVSIKYAVLKYDESGSFISTTGWTENQMYTSEDGFIYKVIVAYTNNQTITDIEDVSELLNVTSVVDSGNIPNLPSMAYLTGTGEVDFDFNNYTVTFPSVVDIFYNGKEKNIVGAPPLSFDHLTNQDRFILFLDIETSTFSLKKQSDNSNEAMVGTIQIPNRQAWINGNYTVDGFSVGSNGRNKGETFQDVFYRYKKPVITSNKITFPKGFNVYKYDASLGTYSRTPHALTQDVEFTWEHNTSIVWDLESNTIVDVIYPERIRKGIVLFRNIDGKLVSGALKAQYDAESVTVPTVPTDNKTYKDIGKLISKTNTTRTGTPNGSAVVGNEYWAFNASNDENTTYADCHRWSIDENTYGLTYVGSFSHNWGHVNSADYCAETDTLICGNGSGSYVLEGKMFIFANASAFKDMTQVPLNDNAIIIDVGMTYGAKVNVVWGNDNDGRYDIAHIITNDNKDITRIQLGKGTVNLGLGNFIADKTDSQFNGSYKVLKTWNQLDGGDVVQGADYGDDGCVYVGLGHKGAWYSKQYLNEDGTISSEVSKSIYINADGTENAGYSGSISLYKDKILIRVLKDGKQWVHVCEK